MLLNKSLALIYHFTAGKGRGYHRAALGAFVTGFVGAEVGADVEPDLAHDVAFCFDARKPRISMRTPLVR